MRKKCTPKIQQGARLAFIITYKLRLEFYAIVIIYVDIDERFCNFARKLWSQHTPNIVK